MSVFRMTQVGRIRKDEPFVNKTFCLLDFQHFDVSDDDGMLWWIYYVTLHIIGAQFMLNLVLGVLSG